MKLKRIAMLGLCSLATLVSCSPSTSTLSYEKAKEWVINNYKNNSKEQTLPKTIEASWALHGHVTEYLKTTKNTKDNVRDHMNKIIDAFCFCGESSVGETYKEDTSNFSEFAYVTSDTIKVESPTKELVGDYFKTLNDENFDAFMEHFFQGYSKNVCTYTVDNKSKTLTIQGALSRDFIFGSDPIQANNYHSLYKIPSCIVNVNSNGTIKSVKFQFDKEETIRFFYYVPAQKNGEGWAFDVTKGSSIEFNYLY